MKKFIMCMLIAFAISSCSSTSSEYNNSNDVIEQDSCIVENVDSINVDSLNLDSIQIDE